VLALLITPPKDGHSLYFGGVLDFAMLHGDGALRNWAFWQETIDMFNSDNPAVTLSTTNGTLVYCPLQYP
jgi:hypothetical protein